MAHKKGQGSSNNGRDSNSKRLGVKLFGGQVVKAGNIIVRQRGTKFHAGENTYLGKDHTIHAKIAGTVKFHRSRKDRTYISIIPEGGLPEVVAPVKKIKTKKVKIQPPVEETVAPIAAVEEVIEETPVVEEAPLAAPAPEPKEEPKAEVEKSAPKKKKSAKLDTPLGKIKQDDLKIVEGIGPKIEGLLKEGGFDTWEKLGNAELEALQAILDAAGPRYRIHNPSTWARQAEMAAKGEWEALKKWQDELDGGKE